MRPGAKGKPLEREVMAQEHVDVHLFSAEVWAWEA